MNANFGLVDDLDVRVRDKRLRKEKLAERALADMAAWRDAHLLSAGARA
jgi:folate-dependent tRNA-U54 methylase TrmFO/GidA